MKIINHWKNRIKILRILAKSHKLCNYVQSSVATIKGLCACINTSVDHMCYVY